MALAALVCTALTVAFAGPAGGASPLAKPATSEVYLIHGVPGGPVDVRVDGEVVTRGLEPADVFGPIGLETGRHTVAFEGDGLNVESPVNVRSSSEDVVLHLPADPAADPTVTVFANDVAPVREGHGRLTVAHTAVVPPADVRADGEVLFANIANGEFVTAEVPADTYEVDVVPTGGDDPLLGPLDLEVQAAALTRVFAIGEPQDGSMQAVVQVIPLSESAVQPPSSVSAGEAGLVAQHQADGGDPRLTLGIALVFGAMLQADHLSRDQAIAGRGLPAPSQVAPERPHILVLPGGTRMPVVPVGTGGNGALELPRDVATAGWWDGGSRLGDHFGVVTVAAHVDSVTQGVGPFAQLLAMRPGDRIQLMSRNLEQTFEVEVSRFVPRWSLAADPDAFARHGPLRLVLITCGGPYDADTGGYRDNVVVVAGATVRR